MSESVSKNSSANATEIGKIVAGSFLKSLSMLFVLLIEFGIISLIIYKLFPDIKMALIIGILINVIYMCTAFFVKKIRTVFVVWLGICSLGLSIWWIYLLISILK